jgi:hypothetical protein
VAQLITDCLLVSLRIRTIWEVQTFYESRYLTNDYFHRLVDILRYVCIGTAIFNITPIQLYSDPRSDNVVVFTLAILAELMITMGLGLELYFKGLGDKVSIKNHTLDDFKFRNGGLFVLYLAAVIIAAIQHYKARKGDPGFILAADAEGNEVVVYVDVDHSLADAHHSANSEVVHDTHSLADVDHSSKNITAGHRVLTSSSYDEVHSTDRALWDMDDLPMTITAAAYVLRFILSSIRLHLRDKKGDVRSWYVPANIDYLIHRYGEFIMLMIGEGVLSLLVVETVEVKEYYEVVLFGMLTMIFIYVLTTESAPSDSSKHAL